MEPASIDLLLGNADDAYVRIVVLGYEHPEVAEPHGLDLLQCRVHAAAGPVNADFVFSLRVAELLELRDYFMEIASGNGPAAAFSLASGLLDLSFAPSRRGPVLCAVQIKSIDESHMRLEFMITLEPPDINHAVNDLEQLAAAP